MMKRIIVIATLCLGLNFLSSAQAVTNLLTNSGFLDLTAENPTGSGYGDGWGFFGATDANAFFGAGNPHASLYGDDGFNTGEVYQLGIPGTVGKSYQFDLMNTRIESAWDADLNFGVEFYAADDTTLLGETFVTADTATRLTLPNVDGGGAANGAVFSMQAVAPAGTAFARPVIKFDNVNPLYVGGETQQANSFVFNTFFSEVPAPGGELIKNSGFEDLDGQADQGDFWGSYGNAGFNDFFSGGGAPNGHASLFADTMGNSGGIYQQSILGTAGTEYEFRLDDVRIESNFDADLTFGLEYFADDDYTKLGDTLVLIDTNTGMVDGNSFSMTGTAPLDTKYVRPIVSFGNVAATVASDAGVFIFGASLSEYIPSTDNADFDEDGDVDGKDFLTWQRGFGIGNSLSQGDANNSGTVDGVDLSIWQAQYGSGGNPLVGTVAVPEPATLSVSLIAMALVVVPWRRGW